MSRFKRGHEDTANEVDSHPLFVSLFLSDYLCASRSFLLFFCLALSCLPMPFYCSRDSCELWHSRTLTSPTWVKRRETGERTSRFLWILSWNIHACLIISLLLPRLSITTWVERAVSMVVRSLDPPQSLSTSCEHRPALSPCVFLWTSPAPPHPPRVHVVVDRHTRWYWWKEESPLDTVLVRSA